MKKLLIALAAVLVSAATYAQTPVAQVFFANRVTAAGLDAPVTLASDPTKGPGGTWSAQLFLSDAAGTSLTPITGATTAFNNAGTGAAAIADRYFKGITVDLPSTIAPLANQTFVVGAYPTAAGTFDAAKAAGTFGVSTPFTVTVGGGTLPPANLTTLTAFTVAIPEPSVIALGVLGASALLLRRRK